MNILRKKLNSVAKSKESFFLFGEPGFEKEDFTDFIRYSSIYFTELRSYEKLNLSRVSDKAILKALTDRPKAKKETPKRKEWKFNLSNNSNADDWVSNIFKKSHQNVLLLTHIEFKSWEVQLAFIEVIRTQKYLNRQDIFSTQLIFALDEAPQKLLSQKKLHPELFYLLRSIHIPSLRDRIQDLRQIIPEWLRKKEIDPANFAEELFTKFMDYNYPYNLVELERLLHEMLENHKTQYTHKNMWKQNAISLSSLPLKLSTASIKLSEMQLEVAKLELSYIDRALQKYQGNKGKAAEALRIKSGADNLKKSYVDKYWKKYPELILQYPIIVKVYKLGN